MNNKLKMLDLIKKKPCGHNIWSVECHCGKIFQSSESRIKGGITTSCGCIRKFNKAHIYGGGRKNKGSIAWAKDKIGYSILASKKYNHAAADITPEKLSDLYAQHNHCCDICSVPESECTKGLALDHDHQTGEFRGFICNNCNRGLGLLGDNLESIEKVVKYLSLK